MNYIKIRSKSIVPCYGITKIPENNNYAMVLNYLGDGNLRNYLQKNHSNLTLKDRITMFAYLCDSLDDIHEKDLIHCDLHSGNILVDGGCCYITDLGLCGPVDDESSNKIYGVIPYILFDDSSSTGPHNPKSVIKQLPPSNSILPLCKSQWIKSFSCISLNEKHK